MTQRTTVLACLLLALAGCGWLERDSLTVTWTTESELDIIGFNLYRATSEDGPFEKVNERMIPPAVDPFLGGEHSFVDEEVEGGATYYYMLESVGRTGGATREGPIAITAGG